MATLYISEYKDVALSNLGHQGMASVATPPIQEQTLAIGATATSAQFNSATRFVLVHTDVICSINFSLGTAATVATNKSCRMAANETRLYGVNPNGFISVITNS